MEKVLEASQNIIKESPRYFKGRWSVVGKTSDDLEILIVFDMQNSSETLTGKIVTVFPVFNKGQNEKI